MQTFKSTTHTCQIDCTNHDEVINNLELKSKDLYYFWVTHHNHTEKLRMAIQQVLQPIEKCHQKTS